MNRKKTEKIIAHARNSIPGFMENDFIRDSLNNMQGSRLFAGKFYLLSARILKFMLSKKE